MSGRASLSGGFSTDAAATRSNYSLRGSIPPAPNFSLFEALLISFFTGIGFVAAAFLLLIKT